METLLRLYTEISIDAAAEFLVTYMVYGPTCRSVLMQLSACPIFGELKQTGFGVPVYRVSCFSFIAISRVNNLRRFYFNPFIRVM